MMHTAVQMASVTNRVRPDQNLAHSEQNGLCTSDDLSDADLGSARIVGKSGKRTVINNEHICNTANASESCDAEGGPVGTAQSPKNDKENSAIPPNLPDNQPHNNHFFSCNNVSSMSPNSCSYGAYGSVGGTSSRINSVLMSSRRKLHSISEHIPLVRERPKPPLGEAVRRALQALANAHNEMEGDRDPDPRKQIKERTKAKRQKEKEMAAFNRKYFAVSRSARIKRVLNGGDCESNAGDRITGAGSPARAHGVYPDVSRTHAHEDVSNAPYGANDDIVVERENIGEAGSNNNTNTASSPPFGINRVSGNDLSPSPETRKKSSGGFFSRLFCVKGSSEIKESTRESQRAVSNAVDDGNFIGDSGVVSLVPGGKVRVMAPSATATHVSMNAHKNSPQSSNSTNPVIVAKDALELEAEGGTVISSKGGSAAVVASSTTATTTTTTTITVRTTPTPPPSQQQVGEDRTPKVMDEGLTPNNKCGVYINDFGDNDVNGSGDTTRETTLNLNEILLRTTTTAS